MGVTVDQGILVKFMLMSPEDISENFSASHHCKNLKFVNFDESQLKMMSPGLINASSTVLCDQVVYFSSTIKVNNTCITNLLYCYYEIRYIYKANYGRNKRVILVP